MKVLDRILHRDVIVERKAVSYQDADALVVAGWEIDTEREDGNVLGPLLHIVHLCRKERVKRFAGRKKPDLAAYLREKEGQK